MYIDNIASIKLIVKVSSSWVAIIATIHTIDRLQKTFGINLRKGLERTNSNMLVWMSYARLKPKSRSGR